MNEFNLDSAMQAYSQYGWLGLVGVLLTGIVGFYKLDVLQNLLPEVMRWQSLKPVARALLVFVFAFLGVGILAYAKTASIAAAIGAAIQAGLVAMGGKAVIDASKPAPTPPTLPPVVIDREASSIRTSLSPGNL